MPWSCLFLLIGAHPHRRGNRVSPVAKPADIPVDQPTHFVIDNVYSRRVVRLQRQSWESIHTVPKVSMAEAASGSNSTPDRSMRQVIREILPTLIVRRLRPSALRQKNSKCLFFATYQIIR